MRAGFTLPELIVTCIIMSLSLSLLGCFVPLNFYVAILTGWFSFLHRVLPQMTIDETAVITAVLALVGFLLGTHWIGKRWAAQSGSISWPWRRSFCLLGAVLLMFCSGIAMIGVGHQVVWLVRSDERIIANSFDGHYARNQSHRNLKTIGLSLHNYHEANDLFPPGGTFDDVGRPMHSWATALLPFLDENDLHDQIDQKISWDDDRNLKFFQTQIVDLQNPNVLRLASHYSEPVEADSKGRALTHYAANARMLGYNSSFTIDGITDGASQTMLAGEVNANFRPWGDPLNIRDPKLGVNKSPYGFGSPFEGGVHVLYADGRVNFISEDIDPQVFEAAGTPAGGD